MKPDEERIRQEIAGAAVRSPSAFAAPPPLAPRRSAMTTRRLGIAAAIAVIALGLGYAYASPYLTVSRVKRAAQHGDAETINAHIDFPALRESVKGWIGAAMAKEMAKSDVKNNPFSGLGAALGVAMADKLVEAMLTPEWVRLMLAGEHPRPTPAGQARGQGQNGGETDTETVMGYEAYDRFAVRVRNRARPEDEVTMVWHRVGLTWKLAAVRLPAPPE